MNVKLDNTFPANQFHFSRKKEGFTNEEKDAIERAIKIPFTGFVKSEIFGRRVIITSTTDEPVQTAAKLLKAINKALEMIEESR